MKNNQIPIFVISLTSATARRQSITEQMSRWGLEFTFFDAINGSQLTEHQQQLVDTNWDKKRRGDPLRPGEIGCALSHAMLYKKIIEENLEKAIILEDDAHLTSQFKRIALQETTLPKDIHLIIFHAHSNQYARKQEAIPVSSDLKLYEAYGRFLGACG